MQRVSAVCGVCPFFNLLLFQSVRPLRVCRLVAVSAQLDPAKLGAKGGGPWDGSKSRCRDSRRKAKAKAKAFQIPKLVANATRKLALPQSDHNMQVAEPKVFAMSKPRPSLTCSYQQWQNGFRQVSLEA